MGFLELRQEPGVYYRVTAEMAIPNSTLSAKSEHLSSYDGHLSNLNKAWQDNTDASVGEVGDQASLSSFHRDIGIPINFLEESGLLTFEALNSTSLSRCQEM